MWQWNCSPSCLSPTCRYMSCLASENWISCPSSSFPSQQKTHPLWYRHRPHVSTVWEKQTGTISNPRIQTNPLEHSENAIAVVPYRLPNCRRKQHCIARRDIAHCHCAYLSSIRPNYEKLANVEISPNPIPVSHVTIGTPRRKIHWRNSVRRSRRRNRSESCHNKSHLCFASKFQIHFATQWAKHTIFTKRQSAQDHTIPFSKLPMYHEPSA